MAKIKLCPICGTEVDVANGFRQNCSGCGMCLIKRPAIFKDDWIWMVDADKLHMSSPPLWGANYLPIKRLGENKRTVNGFLFFEGNKYVIRSVPAIMQHAKTNIKTADLSYDTIDEVLYQGWLPQSRIYDDRR